MSASGPTGHTPKPVVKRSTAKRPRPAPGRPAPARAASTGPRVTELASKKRRSLTHVGGQSSRGGDPELALRLSAALEVQSADPAATGREEQAASTDAALDEIRPHVHGFHVYPARLHPSAAANLIDALSEPGQVVLDPFVGSGTVVVEALAAGRLGIGSDLNPLAVDLSRCKVHAWTPNELIALREAVQRVIDLAEERRKKRAGATRRYETTDTERYPPHILLELDGLRHGIEQERVARIRRTLLLVLSSILTKLSFARGDAAFGQTQKRIPGGQAIRLFARRAKELEAQLIEYGDLVREAWPATRRGKGRDGQPAPAGRHPGAPIYFDDARVLGEIPDASVDLILTSPPYAGTYDYLEHHKERLRWLGLPIARLQENELGARRDYRKLNATLARRRWDKELHAMLVSMARVLRPGGRAVLILGDSALLDADAERAVALRADELTARAAKGTGLFPLARASQDRPHFHGPTADAFAEVPRREHALCLVKGAPKR